MPTTHFLTVIVFLPALGALALLILRGDDHVWIRRLALVVSVAEFVLSLLLIPAVPLGSAGYHLEILVPWISSPPITWVKKAFACSRSWQKRLA